MNPTSSSRPYKIFISTGEVSGDLQGALLIKALHRLSKIWGVGLDIVALGGEQMEKAGCTLLGNTSAIGSVGLLESLPFILPTLQVQHRAKQYLKMNPPDVVVLIDYMGPNLTIGGYVKRHLPGVPVVFYIAPQLWVWSPFKGNVEQIVKMSDRLLAIFPQEADFFEKQGANVHFVGHPLVDRLDQFPSREEARKQLGISPETTAVALLPASRSQELKYLLPIIFEAAKQLQEKLPQIEFWIPLSLEKFRQPIETAIEQYGLRATIVTDASKTVLAAADLAIAKSGTVNLEIALLNVPLVVLYRVHPFTYWVARRLFKFSIPFMSPPNLVEMQPIVPELLQEQATPENVVQAALELLFNSGRREQILVGYQQMRTSLGNVGVCDRAAQEILLLANC